MRARERLQLRGTDSDVGSPPDPISAVDPT